MRITRTNLAATAALHAVTIAGALCLMLGRIDPHALLFAIYLGLCDYADNRRAYMLAKGVAPPP